MLRNKFIPISTGGRIFSTKNRASTVAINVEFDGTLDVPAVASTNFPGTVTGTGYPGGMLLNLTLNFDPPKNPAEAPEYTFSIVAGGQIDTLTVSIMYTEQYNRNLWRTTRAVAKDNPYAMAEIDIGSRFVMSELSTRFAMCLQYLTVLRYSINDLRWRLNTRKKIGDLIASSISGVFADAFSAIDSFDEEGLPIATKIIEQDGTSTLIERQYKLVERVYDYSASEYKDVPAVKKKQKIVSFIKIWKADATGALWYPICNAQFSFVDSKKKLSNGVVVSGLVANGYQMVQNA